MADTAMELAEILHQLCDSPAKTAVDCGPDRCLGVARALVATGWIPRRALAREFARTLHAYIARSPWMSPQYRIGMRDAAKYAWPIFAADEEDAAHRRQVAEEIAQAIEAHDGPIGHGPRISCARIARAHKESGHG
jgi:hypothetical protein